MGHLFEYMDQIVWAPNRDVALCFLAQVRHLEERLGLSSGLTEVMSDSIDIDPTLLKGFLISIGTWANLENNSMRLLLSGALAHLLALLASCEPPAKDLIAFYPSDWADEARELALRVMTPVGSPPAPP